LVNRVVLYSVKIYHVQSLIIQYLFT